MAENAKLIADGALMDRNLTHEKLEEVSQALAKRIKILVPTGSKAYVAASRQYRQKKEPNPRQAWKARKPSEAGGWRMEERIGPLYIH